MCVLSACLATKKRKWQNKKIFSILDEVSSFLFQHLCLCLYLEAPPQESSLHFALESLTRAPFWDDMMAEPEIFISASKTVAFSSPGKLQDHWFQFINQGECSDTVYIHLLIHSFISQMFYEHLFIEHLHASPVWGAGNTGIFLADTVTAFIELLN